MRSTDSWRRVPIEAENVNKTIARSIAADLVYASGRFQHQHVIHVDEVGKVQAVGPGSEADLRLVGCALIPGFVNGHSHAFQRALRGRTAAVSSDRDDNFWTWRQEMYSLVDSLQPESLRTHSLRAFREMAASGFTSVGEFHYLHRDASGKPYDDPNLLARIVIDAARQAGLRITLLNVYYERAGMGDEPLAGPQKRFAAGELDQFCDRTRALQDEYESDTGVSVGLAAHSLRGVKPESLRELVEVADREGWAFHIHLSEQIREVEEAEEIYGKTPVELVHSLDALSANTTGVHCTHISNREIQLLAESGATVCACPTTEADLGDGFLRAGELRTQGVPIALGSDSQARIDPFEEMRSVEYHERLRRQLRNVLAREAEGGSASVAPELLDMATRWGGRSLGLEVGCIEPGAWADLVALDLEHPVLAGWSEETLPAAIALSCDPRAVAATFVGGTQVFGDELSSDR